MRAIFPLAVVFLSAQVASAEPAPSNLATVSLPALATRSGAIQYERNLNWNRHFSLASGLGLRRGALVDYSSTTLATSVECRVWVPHTELTRYRGPSMLGLFAGLRLGLGRTTTRTEGRLIGDAISLSETINTGYRFAFFGRWEVTASVGLQLKHEFEQKNRLPSWTRAAIVWGATTGFLF